MFLWGKNSTERKRITTSFSGVKNLLYLCERWVVFFWVIFWCWWGKNSTPTVIFPLEVKISKAKILESEMTKGMKNNERRESLPEGIVSHFDVKIGLWWRCLPKAKRGSIEQTLAQRRSTNAIARARREGSILRSTTLRNEKNITFQYVFSIRSYFRKAFTITVGLFVNANISS